MKSELRLLYWVLWVRVLGLGPCNSQVWFCSTQLFFKVTPYSMYLYGRKMHYYEESQLLSPWYSRACVCCFYKNLCLFNKFMFVLRNCNISEFMKYIFFCIHCLFQIRSLWQRIPLPLSSMPIPTARVGLLLNVKYCKRVKFYSKRMNFILLCLVYGSLFQRLIPASNPL